MKPVSHFAAHQPNYYLISCSWDVRWWGRVDSVVVASK